MNDQAIRRLQKKFIFITTLSFFVVMLLTGFLVNLSTQIATREQMFRMLDEVIEGEGELPEYSVSSETAEDETDSSREHTEENRRESMIGADLINTPYFAAVYDGDQHLLRLRKEHAAYVSDHTAQRMADLARHSLFRYGWLGNYYFKIGTSASGNLVVAFADSSSHRQITDQVIRYTVLICAVGLFLTILIVVLLSRRAIEPEIENMRRQKEFITNASHELKTPLAVIRANTELIEMMNGESEWTTSTMRQVEYLNGLIQNLVMITKAQEKEDRTALSPVNISNTVNETIDPFTSLAIQDKKTLERHIEEEVILTADESKIRQLTSILIDNAFKYCDENGLIRIELSSVKKGKAVRLAVTNSYAEGKGVHYEKFFDRFYREDQSHTNQAGYGIGLSMAESICRQYSGSIQADWKDGLITFTCILH